jgi:hypothetical protein
MNLPKDLRKTKMGILIFVLPKSLGASSGGFRGRSADFQVGVLRSEPIRADLEVGAPVQGDGWGEGRIENFLRYFVG